MGNDDGTRSDKGVQSVERALKVLEILAQHGEVGVSALAAEVGIHKSSVRRRLSSLEEHELVAQSYARGKYRLSLGVLRLAAAVPERLEVTEQSHAVCERLAAKLGETVNVAVLRSRFVVNLDQARGPSALGTHNWIGELTPVHATSSGKVLLAHLDGARQLELLDTAELERYTERTITSVPQLTRELKQIRRNGYALAVEEFEDGLNAIAAPIRDFTGRPTAALSVSGPAFRFTQERMREAAPDVLAASAEISERMGYRGQDAAGGGA